MLFGNFYAVKHIAMYDNRARDFRSCWKKRGVPKINWKIETGWLDTEIYITLKYITYIQKFQDFDENLISNTEKSFLIYFAPMRNRRVHSTGFRMACKYRTNIQGVSPFLFTLMFNLLYFVLWKSNRNQ